MAQITGSCPHCSELYHEFTYKGKRKKTICTNCGKDVNEYEPQSTGTR
jgi:uncharacterized protein (DUF983 family)